MGQLLNVGIFCFSTITMVFFTSSDLVAGCNTPSSHRVFNVKEFGAISDGKSDISKALMIAWNEACKLNGIGRVLIPEGTFMLGPVVMKGPCKSSIVFDVKGLILAPALNFFTSETWVEFQHVRGLMITGGGKFDGRGAGAWPYNNCSGNQSCKPLPSSLRLSFVNDTTIRGISSTNSKFFHMIIFASHKIRLQRLTISAPGDSPNTDGIHISSSSQIDVSRSVIGTGDDCISIGPGSSNISIYNVFCGPGHGISVGSLGRDAGEGDVAGLIVKNCTFTGTENGVRIKTWPGYPFHTSASNLTFKNLNMKNVKNPIVIDQQYCPYSSCDLESPSKVQLSNIFYSDIRGVSASKIAVNIMCSKKMPCKNVELNSINLKYVGEDGESSVSSCYNVHNGVSLGQQIPPSCV